MTHTDLILIIICGATIITACSVLVIAACMLSSKISRDDEERGLREVTRKIRK